MLDITGYFQDDSDYGYLGDGPMLEHEIITTILMLTSQLFIWLPDPGHASDHMDGLPQVTTIGCLGLMLTSEVSIGVTIQKIWGLTAGGKNAQEWIIRRDY